MDKDRLGTGGGGGGGGNFGQNEVYHNLSYNIPHLHSWVDEIIKLTEKSLPARVNPTTEDLVESVYRYDACFREMLRQTNTFSPDLTRIYSKIWIGVLSLLDSMVKMYHRHVTQTASLQEQARELIHQRQAQVAASKIKQEEEVLERTALRATIRNLEGEVESIRSINRELDRENRGLRALVETYIDARDFDNSLLNLVANNQENLKPKKMNALDASRSHVDTVNQLDVEMNELLSSVQTEEDRQLALLSQFDTLLTSNEELLTFYQTQLQHDQRDQAATTKEIGVQVNEKDSFGVVDDSLESALTGLGTGAAEDCPEFPPGPVIIPSLIDKSSVSVPYELRKLMASFPHVLRIPSLEWTKQAILSIYFSKIRYDQQALPQTSSSSMTQYPLATKKTMCEYIHAYYSQVYGISVVADVQIMVLLRACLLYASSSKRVLLFAEQIGLADPDRPPLLGIRDTDLILTVLGSLQEQGELQPLQSTSLSGAGAGAKISRDRSSDYTPSLPSEEVVGTGAGSNSGPQGGTGIGLLSTPLNTSPTIPSYMKRSVGLYTAQTIFEKWLPDGGNEYLLKIRALPNTKGSFHVDLDDFLEITVEQWGLVKSLWTEHLSCLFHYNSAIFKVISESQFATEAGNPDRDTVLAQIIRDPTNVLPIRSVRMFPDAALHAAAAAQRKVELYEKNQREFLKFKDEGIDISRPRSRDSSHISDKKNRPESPSKGVPGTPLDGDDYENGGQYGDGDRMNSGNGNGNGKKDVGTGAGDGVQGGGAKESVVELMSKKSFVSALRNLKPDLSVAEVNSYFRAAQELGYEMTKRQLEAMWITFPHPIHNRIVYYNRVTAHCQWTCPYRLKTFEAHDIDESSFIEIILRYQLIDKSPLLEYFHVTPSDLWPNTEVFYRELELAKRRENVKRKQAIHSRKKATITPKSEPTTPPLTTRDPSSSN